MLQAAPISGCSLSILVVDAGPLPQVCPLQWPENCFAWGLHKSPFADSGSNQKIFNSQSTHGPDLKFLSHSVAILGCPVSVYSLSYDTRPQFPKNVTHREPWAPDMIVLWGLFVSDGKVLTTHSTKGREVPSIYLPLWVLLLSGVQHFFQVFRMSVFESTVKIF